MTLNLDLASAIGPGQLAEPEHLVRVHVSSDRLGAATGDARPEAQMFRPLRAFPATGPPRILVHGEAGSGKTSLVLRAIAEATAGHQPLEALVLHCGEDPTRIASSAAFIRYLIDALRGQKRFTSLDLEELVKAAAITRTVTPGTATQTFTGGGGPVPVAYTFQWADAVESITAQASQEEQRQMLADQVEAAAAEHRLVVVIDDTDKFAMERSDGTLDEQSIGNLFRHGVSFLLEMPVAVIVAVHPAYRNVPAVREITRRGNFLGVEVAKLPLSAAPLPLETILDKRLEVARRAERARDVFHHDALAQLQGIYFAAGRHDLRAVLRLCETSARLAVAANAEVVSIEHVQEALEEL